MVFSYPYRLKCSVEFHRKNPKIENEPRVVEFRSGCYKRQWVENVVALGNSGGFVEPLESTALMILCQNTRTLVDFLLHNDLEPTDTMRDLYNDVTHASWKDIRDFLAIHYKFNGMLDTPFWKQARADTDVSGVAELLKFYEENGPTGFCRYRMPRTESDFGLEGYLVMLVGNQVPYRKRHAIPARENELWTQRRAMLAREASKGIKSEEALAYVKHPGWRWNGDPA